MEKDRASMSNLMRESESMSIRGRSSQNLTNPSLDGWTLEDLRRRVADPLDEAHRELHSGNDVPFRVRHVSPGKRHADAGMLARGTRPMKAQ